MATLNEIIKQREKEMESILNDTANRLENDSGMKASISIYRKGNGNYDVDITLAVKNET